MGAMTGRGIRRMLGVLVVAGVGATACGGDDTVTKAGATDEPVVLRFGTDDFPGRPSAEQIQELGRRVAELTDGQLQIEGVWRTGRGGDDRGWDQRVAQRVIDGELDGGNIPTRSWDLMGVTSMTALHAPFLVTSEAALHAVVADEDLTDSMLAGLEGSGVVGLAVAPESIRFLFGLQDPPIADAADLDGALVRSPASATTWSTLEALGAVPDDIPDMDAAIADGSLAAVESSFGLIDSTPRVGALGNLPLFPKANVLVVNDDVYEELSDEHRAALDEAARATAAWAVESHPRADAMAAEFCEGDGQITHLSDADVEALHERTAPVVEAMAADPEVASMLDRIREVVSGIEPGRGVAACVRPVVDEVVVEEPTFDVDELEGTYRFELTADDMRAGGASEDWIERNSFVSPTLITITLDGGAITVSDVLVEAPGTYTVSGSEVTFRIDDWSSHWVMTPEFTDDGITWTFVESLPPWGGQEDEVIDAAFWTTHPWVRVRPGS